MPDLEDGSRPSARRLQLPLSFGFHTSVAGKDQCVAAAIELEYQRRIVERGARGGRRECLFVLRADEPPAAADGFEVRAQPGAQRRDAPLAGSE